MYKTRKSNDQLSNFGLIKELTNSFIIWTTKILWITKAKNFSVKTGFEELKKKGNKIWLKRYLVITKYFGGSDPANMLIHQLLKLNRALGMSLAFLEILKRFILWHQETLLCSFWNDLAPLCLVSGRRSAWHHVLIET